MGEFQYTKAPAKIASLFQKLRGAGVPPKATGQWLKSLGFTSSDDLTMLPVMKAIGFIDASGIPTDAWKQYRGADHKHVIGLALHAAYRDLFQVFPDASSRTDAELESFFSTRTTGGARTISRTLATFKNLASLADFTHVGGDEHLASVAQRPHAAKAPSHGAGIIPTAPPPASPALHIDVQIHIASDATPEQIDQIFASMAKHLYKQ